MRARSFLGEEVSSPACGYRSLAFSKALPFSDGSTSVPGVCPVSQRGEERSFMQGLGILMLTKLGHIDDDSECIDFKLMGNCL